MYYTANTTPPRRGFYCPLKTSVKNIEIKVNGVLTPEIVDEILVPAIRDGVSSCDNLLTKYISKQKSKGKNMSRLLDVMTAPWAITTSKLKEIGGIYLTHLRGEKIDISAVEAKLGHPLNNDRQPIQMINGIAIISAHGVIGKRMNMFMQVSGGVSTEILGEEIQAAIDDPMVQGIILDIDSPGGTVDGTFELADGIFNARGTKPIVALANGLMASAAYAIGSAADAVYMSGDTTHVGSIGVVTAHTDYSKYEENMGIKTTEIYAGKYKRIASEHEPLTDAGKQDMQDSVDYLYSIFVERVAKFRGVAVSAVLEDMADGRLFIGQQAIDAGLVDGVSTLDELVAELSKGRMPGKHMPEKQKDAGAALDVDAGNTNLNTTEVSEMDKTVLFSAIDSAFIAENCPDVAAGFRKEGAEAAKAEAAAAECARIKDVFAQSMPGHESLIKTLAFDGKTTGPEAAVQILQAERGNAEAAASDVADDAAKINLDASVSADLGDDEAINSLPFDEKCKAKWDRSEDLQAEFGGSFERYLAYEKANPKVLGGKK